MSNYLNNGTVLPHGLLGSSDESMMAGFNKSYKNYPLRIGIVIKSYPVSDSSNVSKLTMEYDVLVIEQYEDKGTTPILYRNCMNSEGLGSIADFFEVALRPKKKKTTRGDSTHMKGQDGAIVLLLCLDGMSDKAIILKSLTHPDRKTTLKDEGPRLEGEYNGINIKVEKNGSTTLTFKGATGNDGKVLDSSQGDTVLAIEKDGSFQMKHKAIKHRWDKKGSVALTADDDVSTTTKSKFLIDASSDIKLTTKNDFNVKSDGLILNASGSATLECQKLSVKAKSDIEFKGLQVKVEAEALAKIKAVQITLDGLVSLGGDGGMPVLLMTTMIMGICGPPGSPVISQAISGFATKVLAT